VMQIGCQCTAPVGCIDVNVLMACLGTKTDHVKL